jgi:hypothetical protein
LGSSPDAIRWSGYAPAPIARGRTGSLESAVVVTDRERLRRRTKEHGARASQVDSPTNDDHEASRTGCYTNAFGEFEKPD